jgi:hypothetical protein
VACLKKVVKFVFQKNQCAKTIQFKSAQREDSRCLYRYYSKESQAIPV